jgi:hypothetical protein
VELFNIKQALQQEVSKKAEQKLSAMYKSIPMQGSGPSMGPEIPTPKKGLSPVKPVTPKTTSPSSYGGLDLMAPNITASGGFKTPGAAYSDGLGSKSEGI